MNNRTRRITEGAMLIALIALGLILNRQFGGVLDVYLIWLIPIPLIIYSSKYGFKEALIVSISSVLLAFLVSTPATVFYVAGSSLIGSVYGYLLGKGKSSQILLIVAIVGALIVDYLTMIIFAGFFGYDLTKDVLEIQNLMNNYNFVLPNNWNLKYFVYASVVVGALLEGTLIHLLSFIMLKRLKLKTSSYKPINKIRTPKWLTVITIILIGVYAYYASLGIDDIKVEYALLILIPFLLIVLFYGYICLVTFFKNRGLNKVIWLYVVLLFIFPTISIPLLVGIGLIDGFIDVKDKL